MKIECEICLIYKKSQCKLKDMRYYYCGQDDMPHNCFHIRCSNHIVLTKSCKVITEHEYKLLKLLEVDV